MKYPYNQDYQLPFPTVVVRIANDITGLRSEEVQALIDTGADGTFIPMKYLDHVVAEPTIQTRIRSHWGEWRDIELYSVDIEFDSFKTSSILVIGDQVGDEVILGLNVLNRLRVFLDGPAMQSEFSA
jgi:predicted aspartyl protease